MMRIYDLKHNVIIKFYTAETDLMVVTVGHTHSPLELHFSITIVISSRLSYVSIVILSNIGHYYMLLVVYLI